MSKCVCVCVCASVCVCVCMCVYVCVMTDMANIILSSYKNSYIGFRLAYFDSTFDRSKGQIKVVHISVGIISHKRGNFKLLQTFSIEFDPIWRPLTSSRADQPCRFASTCTAPVRRGVGLDTVSTQLNVLCCRRLSAVVRTSHDAIRPREWHAEPRSADFSRRMRGDEIMFASANFHTNRLHLWSFSWSKIRMSTLVSRRDDLANDGKDMANISIAVK